MVRLLWKHQLDAPCALVTSSGYRRRSQNWKILQWEFGISYQRWVPLLSKRPFGTRRGHKKNNNRCKERLQNLLRPWLPIITVAATTEPPSCFPLQVDQRRRHRRHSPGHLEKPSLMSW